MGILRGLQGGRVCAAWGLWRAPCPRGAGWGTSLLPVTLDKASGSAAPGTAPRSRSCGDEKVSAAFSAASPPSPASRPVCVWVLAGKADLVKAGVLRCCWIAVSDSYVYIIKQKTKAYTILSFNYKPRVNALHLSYLEQLQCGL